MVPPAITSSGYSLSYTKRQLVIKWHMSIDSFEVSGKRWAEKIRPMLIQYVYAKQGNLYTSDTKVIFLPHKISKLAIESVDQMYIAQKKQNNSYNIYTLSRKLFVLAMSGHQLSQTRLLNLDKEFKTTDNTWLTRYQTILKQKLKQR